MTLTRPSTGDLVAGVSVALVAIPQSLAYAELAGLPPQIGLYASGLPPILAAIFVSSRYLQTGPVALTSLLTFGTLSQLAPVASAEYLALAGLLALLVGMFRVALGLLRMGRVAYLLSEPVLTGFTTGAAILIVSSQLPRVLGVDPDGSTVLGRATTALLSPGTWRLSSLGFAALTMVVVMGGRRFHRLFPGVLVAVGLGVTLSTLTGYQGAVVGRLDAGLSWPDLGFPWEAVPQLATGALVIALVGFAEPASIARSLATEERQPWDANREMVSQGVANLASALSGAFPVGGSFSRSNLNRMAGATSPWSGVVAGAVVLAALPLVAHLAPLPQVVLGTIVVLAVINLIKVKELVGLFDQAPTQALVGVGTLAATLAFAPRIERGVLVGVGLAVAVHLYLELAVTVTSSRSDQTLTVSPHGVLWFATVPQLERLIRSTIAEEPELDMVVIDLGRVGRLDHSGAMALERVIDDLRAASIPVAITNVLPGSSQAASTHLAPWLHDHEAPPSAS